MITVMKTRSCKQIKEWISDNITFDFFNFTRKSIAFVADSNNLLAIHMIISIKTNSFVDYLKCVINLQSYSRTPFGDLWFVERI